MTQENKTKSKNVTHIQKKNPQTETDPELAKMM